jgi:hypothetical protein
LLEAIRPETSKTIELDSSSEGCGDERKPYSQRRTAKSRAPPIGCLLPSPHLCLSCSLLDLTEPWTLVAKHGWRAATNRPRAEPPILAEPAVRVSLETSGLKEDIEIDLPELTRGARSQRPYVASEI